MSVQVTTGFSQLVSLGIGAGDVATMINLGHRVGNWWTADSGDREFLDLLDEDEMSLIHRRGLIDLPRFNKKWSNAIRLLVNGKPQVYKDREARPILGPFTRFTAIMVSMIAALDAFCSLKVTKEVVKSVIKGLLCTTEYGEDLMASRLNNRINAWRSAACVRGLSIAAKKTRDNLIMKELILDGFMPYGEARDMAQFLLWLLTENSETYSTSSSDIAGVATSLSELGIDVLNVHGLGDDSLGSSCTLIYSSEAYLHGNRLDGAVEYRMLIYREQSTTISLLNPEESFSKFPIKLAVANRCRQAWTAGRNAAKHVSFTVLIPERGSSSKDIEYCFLDCGSQVARVETEISALVDINAPITNQESCDGLAVCLQRESKSTLLWLQEQTADPMTKIKDHVDNLDFSDSIRIDAFTVFQAFFTGFYYTVFLELVDTTSLEIPTVDGRWGYRSSELLVVLRQYLHTASRRGDLRFRRADVIAILSRMLLSYPILENPDTRYKGRYLGVVAKRALITNSLINPCLSPGDIGRFVLVDVDVGGVPTDSNGLIRPGLAEGLLDGKRRLCSRMDEEIAIDLTTIHDKAPNLDMTLHIEADWDGDPETTLLCARYKGRRLGTLDPAVTDWAFCHGYIEPSNIPLQNQLPRVVFSSTVQNIVEGEILIPLEVDMPVVIQAYNRPFMRYAVVGFYWGWAPVLIATNCIHTAVKHAEEHSGKLIRKETLANKGVVIITGYEM
ncbi:hypothetical protein MMC27_007539 [Xylographa pallens]|nr:hypothetical protein [Xylographa pallens]